MTRRSVLATAVLETLESRRLLAAGGGGSSSGNLAPAKPIHAPQKPAKPDLQALSDNGSSSTDNVTSVLKPVFDVDKVDAGTTVQLLRDGVVVASVFSASGGTVAIQDPAATAGTHDYSARVVSPTTGLSSGDSQALRVQIIASAIPPATPSAPDLDAASDAGLLNNDNLTNATSLSFTVAGVQSGLTVQLLRNGVVIASGVANSTSVTLVDGAALGDGSYSYTAVAVDTTSGLSSAASGAVVVTIDKTAPGASLTPDLSASSDTGASNTDNITSVTNPLINVSGVESGATVQLRRDGVVIASAISSGGAVQFQDVGLADGVYHYNVRQIDAAGNVGATSATLVITVDTSGAAPSAAPDLQAGSDSGMDSTDNLTNVTSPVFDIVGVEDGSTVQLLRDNVMIASGVASGGSITLSDSAVLDGVYHYTTRQIDSAGNASGVSAELAVTVDTVGAATPSAPDLRSASDSGASSSDEVTNVNTPIFDIAGAEAGSTVVLLRDGVVVGTVYTPFGGVVSLQDTSGLADGTYHYTARAVDLAGNVSAGESAALVVTVDATPPSATAMPDLESGSDTGSSNSDNVTASSSLTMDVAGAEDGAMVELLRDGVVVASGLASGGSVALSDPEMLADGVYHYTSRQMDSAGNVSVLSGVLAVTVDTAAPGAPNTPVLALSSDSGIVGDNTTRNRMPVFSVTGVESGATVQLLVDGVVMGSAVADGSGSVNVQSASMLTPGTHSFSVQQIDAAGNAGAASAAASVKLINALASSDFDGDGISDVAVYNAGTWTIQLSSGGTSVQSLGGASDVPVPGDYDGDGKTDLATYRPGGRSFTIVNSSDGSVRLQFVGTVNQIPVAADYDGDGKTDVAVYNNSTGVFTIVKSTGGSRSQTVGPIAGALPAPADFDGDGKADPAVYDAATGNWTLVKSTTAGSVTTHFGAGGGADQPIAADFDGDGYDDIAVYATGSGQFSVLASGSGSTLTESAPAGGVPVAGDYDGDHKIDFAVFDRTSSTWTILKSTGGSSSFVFGSGTGSDQPLPLSSALARKDVLGF